VASRRPALSAARGAHVVVLALLACAAQGTPLTRDELAKTCAEADDSSHCARLVEEVQLRRLPNLALREGGVLKVTLFPSGAAAFADSEGLNGGRSFSLWDYMSEINAVVLFVTNGDEVSFLLVQRATGKTTELPSEPRLSPDRARLATADFCEARCVNEISIWRVTRDGVRKESSWKPRETWSEAVASWTSATNLSIEYTIAGADASSKLERRLADSDWIAAPAR